MQYRKKKYSNAYLKLNFFILESSFANFIRSFSRSVLKRWSVYFVLEAGDMFDLKSMVLNTVSE